MRSTRHGMCADYLATHLGMYTILYCVRLALLTAAALVAYVMLARPLTHPTENKR